MHCKSSPSLLVLSNIQLQSVLPQIWDTWSCTSVEKAPRAGFLVYTALLFLVVGGVPAAVVKGCCLGCGCSCTRNCLTECRAVCKENICPRADLAGRCVWRALVGVGKRPLECLFPSSSWCCYQRHFFLSFEKRFGTSLLSVTFVSCKETMNCVFICRFRGKEGL